MDRRSDPVSMAAVYDPSDKQSAALANMEAYAGIRSNRTTFADRDAFQAYWDLVAARCDHHSRQRRGDPAAQARRRSEAKRAIYQDEERLLAYARKYALRYRPSTNRLQRQLAEQCPDPELCAAVLRRVGPLLDDQARALELAQRLQEQGRNRRHIGTALRRRLFEPACIDRCLASLAGDTGSILDEQALRRRIRTFQAKGLSRQAIRQRLMDCAADRAPVEAALDEALGGAGDDANLRRTLAKLQRAGLDEAAIRRRLLGKGFTIAAIRALSGG